MPPNDGSAQYAAGYQAGWIDANDKWMPIVEEYQAKLAEFANRVADYSNDTWLAQEARALATGSTEGRSVTRGPSHKTARED